MLLVHTIQRALILRKLHVRLGEGLLLPLVLISQGCRGILLHIRRRTLRPGSTSAQVSMCRGRRQCSELTPQQLAAHGTKASGFALAGMLRNRSMRNQFISVSRPNDIGAHRSLSCPGKGFRSQQHVDRDRLQPVLVEVARNRMRCRKLIVSPRFLLGL